MEIVDAQGGVVYGDANIVLTYANCYSKFGNLVFESGLNCSQWANGSWLIAMLSLMGLTESATKLIGISFTIVLVTLFVVGFYTLQTNAWAQSTLFFGSISPPIWLLMERGNFDTLMYLLILCAVYFFCIGNVYWCVFFVFMSATFKFYTLPLLVVILLISKTNRHKLFTLVFLLIGSIQVLSDFAKIQHFPHTAGYNHFGMRIIGNYMNKIGINLSTSHSNIWGLLLLILCLIITLFFLKTNYQDNFIIFVISSKNQILFQFLSIVHLSCFFAGLSVDYRLVFYITSIPILISIINRKLTGLIFSVFLLSIYLTYPSGTLQPLGDLALGIMTTLQLVVTLMLFPFFAKYRKTFFSYK